MLELFTEGFMADRGPLEAYVSYLWEPPDGAGSGSTGPPGETATSAHPLLTPKD